MRKITDKVLLENLINKYGKSKLLNAINKINEGFSNVKNKMTIEEIIEIFDDMDLRYPFATISSEKYPEVEQLKNNISDIIEIYDEVYIIDKSKPISFEIQNFSGRQLIYMYIYVYKIHHNDRIKSLTDFKKYKNTLKSERIQFSVGNHTSNKFKNQCLDCLSNIIVRLNNEVHANSSNLVKNNKQLQSLNAKAGQYIPMEHYDYDGTFYIKTGTFEEFIKMHPNLVVGKKPKDVWSKNEYEYYLAGNFNEIQHRKSGRSQPKLILQAIYYPDTNEFELIYDNPWEGYFKRRKVDYIPIAAYTNKPR